MKNLYSLLFLQICFLATSPLLAQSNSGIPIPSATRCSDALPLCDASPLTIATLAPCDASELAALVAPRVGTTAASNSDFPANNGIWLKWKIEKSGRLLFKITPLGAGDDLDFALFRFADCQHKALLRCMAAGENLGEETAHVAFAADPSPCVGATGLAENVPAHRTSAPAGCAGTNPNFLSPVEVIAGEWYALFVNNYDASRGFRLDFAGSTAAFAPICTPAAPEILDAALGRGGQQPLQIGSPQPNPAQDFVQFEVQSPDARGCRVDLLSAAGVLQQSQRFDLVAGSQWLSLRMADLPAGVFYLRVSVGEVVQTLRFVKN